MILKPFFETFYKIYPDQESELLPVKEFESQLSIHKYY